jgi:hypothetical protein
LLAVVALGWVGLAISVARPCVNVKLLFCCVGHLQLFRFLEFGYSGGPVGKMLGVTNYFYQFFCLCRQGVSGASHAVQRMNRLHLAELLSMVEPLI